MRAPAWLRAAGVLMGLQAVLGGLTYFLFDPPWLAMGFSLIFLLATGQTARARLTPLSRRERWAAALLFQAPGLVGTVNFVLEQVRLYPHNSFGDILDFIMETWHTVLLPWLTLLPSRALPTLSGEALVPFFLALPLLSPVLILWVMGAAGFPRTTGNDR